MRNISFMLTKPQIMERTKGVTRRQGWLKLKPDTHLLGVEKSQGLKLGEKIKPLVEIKVANVRREPLNRMELEPEYGLREAIYEGFDNMDGTEFVCMFCDHNGGEPNQIITRIEFTYGIEFFTKGGNKHPHKVFLSVGQIAKYKRLSQRKTSSSFIIRASDLFNDANYEEAVSIKPESEILLNIYGT